MVYVFYEEKIKISRDIFRDLKNLFVKYLDFFLLPVIFFVCLQEQEFALQRKWRNIAKRVTPFVGAVLLYVIMRTGGQFSHDIGIVTAIHGGHGAENYPLIDKLLSLIKAIGFYSQKIMWPFPLNFAIVEINRPVALAMGIVVPTTLAAAWLFYRRRPFVVGLVWITCFLAPALPVAVNRLAWTPLAERYLYLPLMGLCMIMAILLDGSLRKKTISFIMGLLLFVFGSATAQRNIVWQKNITLWLDVVEKSPTFAAGHNDYAVALSMEGNKQEAQKHYALAETLAAGTGKNLAKSNLALQEGDSEQQLAMLDTILQNEQSPKLRGQLLYSIIRLINNDLIHQESDSEKQRFWIKRLLTCQEQLATLDKNPYHLYRIGQLHLALGEKSAAQAAFATTCQASNDYFTQPACTLATRLAQETKRE